MTNTTHTSLMPHHRLRTYSVAVQLLVLARSGVETVLQRNGVRKAPPA